jgi:hypothetical protein
MGDMNYGLQTEEGGAEGGSGLCGVDTEQAWELLAKAQAQGQGQGQGQGAHEGEEGVDGYAQLAGYDLLNKERASGNVFAGFAEQSLSFPPSYRFVSGSNDYDTSGDIIITSGGGDTAARPAWRNRVLWRTSDQVDMSSATMVNPAGYTSHPAVTCGVHRPVSAECHMVLS